MASGWVRAVKCNPSKSGIYLVAGYCRCSFEVLCDPAQYSVDSGWGVLKTFVVTHWSDNFDLECPDIDDILAGADFVNSDDFFVIRAISGDRYVYLSKDLFDVFGSVNDAIRFDSQDKAESCWKSVRSALDRMGYSDIFGSVELDTVELCRVCYFEVKKL